MSGYGSWVRHQGDDAPAAKDTAQALPAVKVETSTSYWRPLWGIVSIAGFVFYWTGVGFLIGVMFGLLWLLSQPVHVVETQAHTEARTTGGGEGSMLTALLLAALIGGFILLVAFGMAGGG